MPGPVSWLHQMTSIWRAVGAAVAGNSHCDTRRTPAQTAWAGCRWWCWGYALSPRRWYDPTPPEPPKHLLLPAAVEIPTTSPGFWWDLVEIAWPSAMPWCRRDTQKDVGQQPQRHRRVCWCRPACHRHTGAGWVHDSQRRGPAQLWIESSFFVWEGDHSPKIVKSPPTFLNTWQYNSP